MTADAVPPPDPEQVIRVARQGGVGHIGTHHGAIITDPRGLTHAGTGHLLQNSTLNAGPVVNNYVTQRVVEAALGQQRSARLDAVISEIESLRAVFVRPVGFDQLQRRLELPGASLVLTGPSGSGRRTAAKILLYPSAGAASALRLLSKDDLTDQEPLSPDDITEGDRLLLDVSDVEEGAAFARLQNDLLRCVAITEQRKARLIILIPLHRDTLLHDDLRGLICRIKRPDSWQVLAAHLRPFDLPVPDRSQVDSADLSDLEQLPLRSIAKVADLLRQAREQDGGGDVRTWFRAALAATADHAEAVSTFVGGLESVEQRTLLLAAAMAEDGKTDTVFSAQNGLHRRLGYKVPVEIHRIAEPGITDRIRELDCFQTTEGFGRIRFRQLAFGQAVLAHFWDAYPDLRREFSDWVLGVGGWRAGTVRDKESVARRFTEQVARTASLSDLYRVVENWAERGRDEIRLAAVILALVLNDERTDYEVRSQLYHWSRNPRIKPGLGSVLVSVCTNDLAIGHPKQALIRLRWLCDHPSPTAQEARAAISELCEDNRTLEQFLAVLTDRDRFDGELCRSIVTPRRLAGLAGRPSPLAVQRLAVKALETWRLALDGLTPADWSTAVSPWLEHHAVVLANESPAKAAMVRAAVIDLCNRQVELLAQLYSANRAWLRSGEKADWRYAAAAAVEDAVRHALATKPVSFSSIEGEPR
jgi:hypothetical protein